MTNWFDRCVCRQPTARHMTSGGARRRSFVHPSVDVGLKCHGFGLGNLCRRGALLVLLLIVVGRVLLPVRRLFSQPAAPPRHARANASHNSPAHPPFCVSDSRIQMYTLGAQPLPRLWRPTPPRSSLPTRRTSSRVSQAIRNHPNTTRPKQILLNQKLPLSVFLCVVVIFPDSNPFFCLLCQSCTSSL